MYCLKCGAQVIEGARFCPACGAAVSGNTTIKSGAAAGGGEAISGGTTVIGSAPVSGGTTVMGGAAAVEPFATADAPAPIIPPPQQRRIQRPLVALGAGIAVLVIAVAVLLFVRRQPAQVEPSATAGPQPPGQAVSANTANSPAAATAAFDWSGLSPEELMAARASLDQAIAHEEKEAALGASAARPANSQKIR